MKGYLGGIGPLVFEVWFGPFTIGFHLFLDRLWEPPWLTRKEPRG